MKFTFSKQIKKRIFFVSPSIGSGLMVHRNDRWIIRGIVSAGLSDVNNGMCKLTDFIIFTDVEKFLPWIYARMQ